MLQRSFVPLFVLILVHMVTMWVFQVKWISEWMSSDLSAMLGFFSFRNFGVNMHSLQHIVSWGSVVVLFILLCVLNKTEAVRRRTTGKNSNVDSSSSDLRAGLLANMHGSEPSDSPYADQPNRLSTFRTRYGQRLREIVRRFGWALCVVGLLFSALFVPSILGMGLLAAVSLATFAPQVWLERKRVIPVMLLYFLFSLLAQYVYNIRFGFPATTSLQNIGFNLWGEFFWLKIGSQAGVFFLLASFWDYADPSQPVEEPVVLPPPTIDGKDPLDADDKPKRPPPRQQSRLIRAVTRVAAGLRQRKSVAAALNATQIAAAGEDGKEGADAPEEEKPPKPTVNVFSRAVFFLREFFNNPTLKERRDKFLSAVRAVGWFLLEQSYLLSLAFLYIAGLQAINLLNTGYMFIFVLFLVSAKLARRAWLLLIVYTEAVVVLVYSWHSLSNWTSPDNNPIIYSSSSFLSDVVGLKVYETAWDLFAQGMVRHLAIMLFSVAQWQVNKLSDSRQSGDAPADDTADLPEWMKSVSRWFWLNWPYYGLIIVYLTMIVVVVVDTLSLSTLVYLVWYFVCIAVHVKSRTAVVHLRRIWIAIVVISGGILISRYTYQFTSISNWLTSIWPGDAMIKPADFGLVTFSKQGDSTFLSLLGNTVVLLVVVVQMRAFFPGKDSRIRQAEEDPYQWPWWVLDAADFTKRLAMLHIFKLTIITLFILSLAPLSGLNAVYVVFVLWSFANTDGSDSMGLVILFYTAIVTHAQLLYQFSGLQNLYPASIMQWIGLFPAIAGNGRWYLIQGYLTLTVLLVLQRYAARAKRDWYRERNLAPAEEGGRRRYLSLFVYPDEFVVQQDFSSGQLVNGLKWYMSNFLAINAYRAFVGCMLLLVFVRHQFILAPVWLAILGLSIVTRVKWWRRASVPLRITLLFLALEIMAQYVFNLDLPPGWNSPWKSWQPPADWKGAQEWFGITLQSKYVLVADWFAMFVISRILAVERPMLRHTSYWKNIVESIATYEDFQKPRSWYNSVRFYIFRFSLFWILLFIFAAGSVQPDVVSFGYILFALWFLFRESELYRRRNRLWRWARLFNYGLLLIRVIYQAPFIPAGADSPDGFSQIIGLRKVDEIKDLAFDIVIFVLLSAQKLLFERKEFDLVVRYILDEEDKGIRVAHQRFQEWKKERRKQLEKVSEEKKRRKQQLELLKAARHHQQKLWMQMRPENGGSIGSKTATLLPGATLQPGMLGPLPGLELDPRMHTLSTTEDLKRLQEAGALDIEQDDDSKEILIKFARPPAGAATSTLPPRAPSEGTLLVPVDEGDEDAHIVIAEPETALEDETPADKSEGAEPTVDEEADAEKASRCTIPKVVLTASDAVIGFLDRFVYMDLTNLKASRPKKIAVGLYKIYQRYSHFLCYLAFLINAVYNANVVSAFFPLSMFLYALLEIPRPHRLYWNIVFVYTGAILLIKFLFQMSIFCTCNGATGDFWSVYPNCPSAASAVCDFERQKGGPSFIPSYPNIIGIRKFDDTPFIVAVMPDVIVLMAVWMHRHWLKKQGYWAFVKRYIFAADDDESMKLQVLDETRHYEKILLQQAQKRERWGEMEAQHRMRRLQKARRWVSKGKANADLKSWLIREQEELKEEILENPIFGNPLADLDPNSEEADRSRLAVQGALLARVGETIQSPSPSPLIPHVPKPGTSAPEILVDISSDPKSFSPPSQKKSKKSKDKQRESDSISASSSKDALAAIKKNRRTSRFLITTPKARQELDEQKEEQEMREKKEKHKAKQKRKEKEGKAKKRLSGGVLESEPQRPSQSTEPEAEQPPPPLDLVSLAAGSSAPVTGREIADLSEDNVQNAFRDAALEISDELEEDESSVLFFQLCIDLVWLVLTPPLSSDHNPLWHRMKKIGHEFRVFYSNLVDMKAGRDLYVVQWFTELVCFFMIMLLPSVFISGVAANVAQFFTSGRSIPMSYVLTLLTQFLLIVVDRIIYLFRAVRVKVIFQYLQVIFLHFWLWFYLPSQNGDYFVRFPTLIIFYMLKFCYLTVSGLQIAYGYPQFVQGQFLTDSKAPSQLRYYAFVAYRAIPFVYELRTLLDWTITKTTLSFYEWLKLEDVYAQLFLVKCRVTSDHGWERNVGDKQPWYMKLLVGALLFGALVLIIWFPLLALMQGSPGSSLNPIVAADVKIAFQAYGSAIYVSLAQNITSDINTDTFNQIRLRNSWISPEDQKLMQIIQFTDFSDELWSISPPARESLALALSRNDSINMYAYLTFTRQKPIQNAVTMSYQTTGREIPNEFKPQIAAALKGQTGANFTVFNLLPRFYRVPIVPPIQIPQPQGPFSVTLSLRRRLSTDTLNGFNDTRIDEYWKASQNDTGSDDHFYNSIFPPGKIQVAVFSSEVPSNSVVETLASSGLIGLYVGIVLAVGRFLRLSITDLSYRIVFEDMPECDELLSYCEDIFLARQDGDLKLEEELFRELIELYRSPERLLLRTLPKGQRFKGRKITAPPAAGAPEDKAKAE